MPRYFFDIDDGENHFRDDEGHDLLDVDAAKDEAVASLLDIARSPRPDGKHEFKASIRPETGDVVSWVKLSLTTGWV